MTHRLSPEILRAYDIRGRVGDTLTEADAWAVGRGFATRVPPARRRRVAVGYDGRTHSPMPMRTTSSPDAVSPATSAASSIGECVRPS